MPKPTDGCVKPVQGLILPEEQETTTSPSEDLQEVQKVLAQVSKQALDFEASAFVAGKGFTPVKLSDYKGKWIVICFYPGDFTYV
jgi:peroxiredoxin (alkyl hydroperoxide reductase subunit C)